MQLPFYEFLTPLPWWLSAAFILIGALALGFRGSPLWAWGIFGVVVLYGLGAPLLIWIVFVLALVPFLIPPIRLQLSKRILGGMRASGFMPAISNTERAALEAGTVWVEGELFSGKPDFARIDQQPYPELTHEEQAFLDGPVEEVCRMTDDWEVTASRDLPPDVWEYLKEQRFFGLIIPREYGGLGFSPLANSAIVQKLTSRSLPLAITVMVPNSLGPAELLIHYGTPRQRDYYLPRLARGLEIPCFGLTEPTAGSDAAAIASTGVVFRDENGDLSLRLNWKKRYITLAAVSTVIGLAFRLYDPERLLGEREDLGITCALVPSNAPGVVLGRRHDPLGIPFVNCPTEGHDVVVPLDAIIGGTEGAGRGWQMLMESLAAGRGISLPALSTAGAKLVTRVASGHGVIRKQFGLPIGRFEGIEALLAKAGSMAYLLDAARIFTCGGLGVGAKPAVVTAILKYNSTEIQREVVNHGMDILGGNGISRGPRNLLASAYIGAPIGITVEGANVLTRTLIIFGQGAIRCHPYALKEINAIADNDAAAFDGAFWAHVGHIVRNGCRALVLTLSRGHLAAVPRRGRTTRYYRRLAWASASFGFWADIAMGTLGGTLKRKEQISGRFADILSWMYLISATLRRFEAEGGRAESEPLMRWSVEFGFHRMQEAFDGLFKNLRVPFASALVSGPIAAWSRLNPLGGYPSDSLSSRVSHALQIPDGVRVDATDGIYVPAAPDEALGRLERALLLAYQAEAVLHRIKEAIRSGELPVGKPEQRRREAVAAGVISEDEDRLLSEVEDARLDYVQVDSFDVDEYLAFGARPAEPEAFVKDL